jgi:hypothetical protein
VPKKLLRRLLASTGLETMEGGQRMTRRDL